GGGNMAGCPGWQPVFFVSIHPHLTSGIVESFFLLVEVEGPVRRSYLILPLNTHSARGTGGLVERLRSTVQVLATGRPIELAGLDHGRWQICVPFPIQDDDRHELFVEEAIADGKERDSAIWAASLALDRLRASPELHLIADTPLFCRLLFDGLQTGTEHETETLGDLLYQLLTKRLKEWAASDQKVSVTPQFDAEYPDAGSRMKLLSDLVGALDRDRPILEE